MTVIVMDQLRQVTVVDEGPTTVVNVASSGAQGPQGNPTTVNGHTGASITLTSADVGAVPTTVVGAASGVASLNSSGHVPLAQMDVTALAGDFLDLSTNQTVATGIKTFSVSPVVPTPTTSFQVATKGYADLMLPLTGGTMSGAIAMATNKITGVGNGSSAQDVAAFGQLPSSTNLLPIASGGTGSTTKSFVDITTAQTVAGVKSFSSPPTGPTPVGSTDLVNKAYVDAIAAGLQPKPSASLATSAALPTNTYNNGASGVGATLTGVATGVLTVDGTAVTLGMTILVKNEATTANNGLYTCTTAGAAGAAYVLTRSVDMNTTTEFPGAYSYVESGTANVGSLWAVSGLGPFTVGTTAVTYVQVGGAGGVSAGTGLTLTGSVMSLTSPVTVALGGTGQTSLQAAMDSLAGAVTTGQFLRGNGTHVVMAAITAADVPTLNQNTTGTASNVTGTVAVANGGTGSATQNFVDLTTGQTVAGAKTFSGQVAVTTNFVIGGTVATNGSGHLQFHDTATNPTTPPTSGVVVFVGSGTSTPVKALLPGGQTVGMTPTSIALSSDSAAFTTTAQTSTGLAVGVEASASYLMQATIFIKSTVATTMTAAYSWTGPTGAAMQWGDTNTTADYASTLGQVLSGDVTLNNATHILVLVGYFTTSTTAGTLTFTAGCSGTTSSPSFKVGAGSFVELTRVA